MTFRKTIKDHLSQKEDQKNTWKYDIFRTCTEEMVFPKKVNWNMISPVLSGIRTFFSPKT